MFEVLKMKKNWTKTVCVKNLLMFLLLSQYFPILLCLSVPNISLEMFQPSNLEPSIIPKFAHQFSRSLNLCLPS